MVYKLYRSAVENLLSSQKNALDQQIFHIASQDDDAGENLSQVEIDNAHHLFPNNTFFSDTGEKMHHKLNAYMADRFRSIVRMGINDCLIQYSLPREPSEAAFGECLRANFPFLNTGKGQSQKGNIIFNSLDIETSEWIFLGLNPRTAMYDFQSEDMASFDLPPHTLLEYSVNYHGYEFQWNDTSGRTIKLIGNQNRSTLLIGKEKFELTVDSSFSDLLHFSETFWDIIISTPHGTEFSHKSMTHSVSTDERYATLHGQLRPKSQAYVFMLDERHQGKRALVSYQHGISLHKRLLIQDAYESDETFEMDTFSLLDLKHSYKRHLGFDSSQGIFFFFTPPPEHPVVGEMEFGYVHQFLWETSNEYERNLPFSTYSMHGFETEVTGEYTLAQIADHTYKKAATNSEVFYYPEDFYHIPMWAISYFEEQKDKEHLEKLKQVALERIRRVLNDGEFMEYHKTIRFGQVRLSLDGFVGHTTEFLGKLAASDQITWTPEDAELIKRWIREITITTPRALPTFASEYSHLVLGLRLLHQYRERVGI
ncbi:MAG: hypothetical protein A3I05_09300 [Deltaproteobacteria bacterium RIFCSPLOWO2_02_FULL_44_10]|nr:MAG: hypothetical protein A3C46_07680 [Deltaproteobacteria bacterium RIFCSPHIGHO2_02_FULL_44_16]OGQ47412.1 MAG: hypothetical protein A3I05_09300 [Deltaproteobacteria bacterium RIFCSPLOWO2_02_FULL_44_10]